MSRVSTPNSFSSRDSVPTCVLLYRLFLLSLSSVRIHIDSPNLSVPWPIMAMEISKSSSDVVPLMREVSPAFPWLATPVRPAHIDKLQSSRVVPNHLFACREIKHSLIHQSQDLPRRRRPRVARQNARQWRSPLTRVTGLQVPATNQVTAHNKRFLMTSGKSY